MADDTFLTIAGPAQGLYKDKGSKFIALAFPVETEEQISDILTSVKKEYYDARHHCYAWMLGQSREHFRTNDDGEPSGTAGKPIHGQLLSAGLTNLLVVVVRYFGGIKLGVRGLIDAYKGATAVAIENAEIITKIILEQYQLDFDYLSMNEVMKILKDHDLPQADHQFDLRCRLSFSVRQSLS
ncbi:MAG: YigZ family protein, partial [Bacteroidales bacterium]|nr:YigZ family protein [Bacteroidales bacterium]